MTRRTNSRLAGIGFLAYIGVGVTQMVLGRGAAGEGVADQLSGIATHMPQQQAIVLLSVLMGAVALTLAASLYSLTREVDRDLALIGWSFRLAEGLMGVAGPMLSLGLVRLAGAGLAAEAGEAAATRALAGHLLATRGWNVSLAAIAFAIGSTVFTALLLRGRMIPRFLAWLGVAASLLLVIGLPLDLVGLLPPGLAMPLWVPMAAFEIPLGFWLVARGAYPPRRSEPGTTVTHA